MNLLFISCSLSPCILGENTTSNPLNNKPLSQNYFKILKTRQGLPVYAQRQEFIDTLHNHQVMVLVGETGSGKTTQIPQWASFTPAEDLRL